MSGLRACHGVPGVDKGGNIRNLAYVATETITNLKDIVFRGPFSVRACRISPAS